MFWIFSIVVIADFRRGLEFVFFSSLRLRTYHCIIDNSTVSEAEDMYTQGHNTFGCPSCNGNCENQREAMHAWASTFLQTPAFCFKAWRDPCLLLALAAPCASILTPLPPWVCVLTQPTSVAACAPCGASGRPGKCRWRDFFFWGGGGAQLLKSASFPYYCVGECSSLMSSIPLLSNLIPLECSAILKGKIYVINMMVW